MAHQVRGTSSVMDKLIQMLQRSKNPKCHLDQITTQRRTNRACVSLADRVTTHLYSLSIFLSTAPLAVAELM